MFLGQIPLDQYLSIPASTHGISGGAVNATSITYTIYDGTNVVAGPTNMTLVSGKTGCYLDQLQVTDALGFEGGKTYGVLIEATVDGVDDQEWHTFSVIGAASSALTASPVLIWKDEAAANNRTLFVDLVLSADHNVPLTGATVSGFIWKPGASAFAAMAGAVTEVGFGLYKVVLAAGDVDTEGFGVLRFTAASAADRLVPIGFLEKKRAFEVLTTDLTLADSLGKLLADNLPLLVNRLGAFTGTGVETVKGFLDALANSSKQKPSGWTNFQSMRDALNYIGGNVLASWGDILDVKGQTTAIHAEASQPVYTCRLSYVADDTAGADEYTVSFQKNGASLGSATPKPTAVLMKLLRRTDGSEIMGSTAMTKLGSTEYYRLDASGLSRLAAGEAAIVEITLVFPMPTLPVVLTEVVGREA
jgi:hypothetical protein